MIDIYPTKSTPRVLFEEQEDTLTISGECYPENSFDFFKPIFNWLKEKMLDDKDLSMSVNISYMNSSSTKCMLDILEILEKAYDNGKKINIIWYYEEDNERTLDLAEEFREDFTMPFDIIAL